MKKYILLILTSIPIFSLHAAAEKNDLANTGDYYSLEQSIAMATALQPYEPENPANKRQWKPQTITVNHRNYHGIVIEPREEYIAVRKDSNNILFFCPDTGNIVRTLKLNAYPAIDSFDFSPDGKFLALQVWHDLKIRIVDTDTAELVRTINHKHTVDRFQWLPQDKIITASKMDETIKLWNSNDNETEICLKSMSFPRYGSFITTKNGELLATQSHREKSGKQSVKIWLAHNFKLLRTIKIDHNISCIAFSPDGTELVMVPLSKGFNALGNVKDYYPVEIRDTHTGKLKRKLKQKTNSIRAVIYPADNLLITETENRKFFLWNALTGQLLNRIESNEGLISSVTPSPDGTHLIVGSNSDAIEIFKTLPTEENKEEKEETPFDSPAGAIKKVKAKKDHSCLIS